LITSICGKRRDPHLAFAILDRGGAGEPVLAVDIHRAGAANALAARAAEGQRAVDLVLDLDQRIQHHRAGFGQIDLERVVARIFAAVGIIAIDLEVARLARALGLVRLALLDDTVLGEREFGHA
jgi:hypothetical protein